MDEPDERNQSQPHSASHASGHIANTRTNRSADKPDGRGQRIAATPDDTPSSEADPRPETDRGPDPGAEPSTARDRTQNDSGQPLE